MTDLACIDADSSKTSAIAILIAFLINCELTKPGFPAARQHWWFSGKITQIVFEKATYLRRWSQQRHFERTEKWSLSGMGAPSKA